MAGKNYIVFLNNHMNARDYLKLFNNFLLPVSEVIGGPYFTFYKTMYYTFNKIYVSVTSI